MKVTMKEAEKLVPVSRTTLYNDKKQGTFTVEKNAKGRTVIDVAELQRVYGELNTSPDESKQPNETHETKPETNNQNADLEVIALRKELELINKANKRERELLEDQIEHLKETLARAQEGQNKLTLLLEHKEKEGGNDFQKALDKLETKIREQDENNKTEKEKILRQNQQLRKALESEKNKSFWQKLFG